MKFSTVVLLLIVSTSLIGQVQRPEPFAEARKAIAAVENAPLIRDSLRRHYKGWWALNFTYGQRFIASYNKTNAVDSVTLADFTRKRSFFGIGTSYFLSRNILLGLGLEFLILPRQQDITFVGISGSGRGSGGLMFSLNLSGKYFFTEWGHTRPYVGLALGSGRLVAKGGNVNFTLFSGREEEINRLSRGIISVDLATGIAHRMTPGSLIDFQISYAHTSKIEPIGRITSPGGIKVAIALQFILNTGVNKL